MSIIKKIGQHSGYIEKSHLELKKRKTEFKVIQ